MYGGECAAPTALWTGRADAEFDEDIHLGQQKLFEVFEVIKVKAIAAERSKISIPRFAAQMLGGYQNLPCHAHTLALDDRVFPDVTIIAASHLHVLMAGGTMALYRVKASLLKNNKES